MKIDEKKADLNKDGKLSGYERKRGEAIAKNLNKGGVVEVQARGCGAMMNNRRRKTRIPRS